MPQRLVALMPIPKERKAGGRETDRVSVLAIDTALRLHRCRAVTSTQGETDCHQGRVLRQPLPGESPFAGPTGVTVGPAADCGRVPEGSPVPDLATCRSGVLHPIAECSRTGLDCHETEFLQEPLQRRVPEEVTAAVSDDTPRQDHGHLNA